MAIEMYKGMNLTGTPSWHGTRDEYDNLAIHDPNTMYFIEDETGSCILWKGTREMFNNLPPEYKNDNTLYVITDESLSVDSEEVSYDNATSGLTSTNVQDAIDEVNTKVNTLPKPMQYKGTLGTGGTIQTLPAVSEENYGFVYKVITNGTYASQSSKIGDMFISNGTEWTYIPSGDDASSFAALTDTNISNPSNGQMPIYDSVSGLWKNEDYIKEVTYATWQTMTDEQKADGKYIVSDYPTVTTAPIIDNQTTASNVWSGQKINNELGNKVNTSDYSGSSLKTSVSKTGSGSTVTNSIAAETSMDTVIGTLLNNDYALNSNLTKRFDVLKDTYTFPNSNAEVSGGNDSYTVQNDGIAYVQYTFANATYSQFNMRLNGVNMFDSNITSNATNLNGVRGAFSFPVKSGDILRVVFYNDFAMNGIKVRVVGHNN